jgi:histidinol-phosphate aminotransferase
MTLHHMALNENPYPPLPSVETAMRRAIGLANRYPQFHPDRLSDQIAGWCGTSSHHVALGSGSVGVALQLFQAVVQPGDTIAFAWRNFDAYPMLAEMVGARTRTVPLLPDGRQDLDALAGVLDDRTRVVIVCNPHNPTGTLVTAPEFAAFMRKVPSHVTVVLDGAYREFARGPGLPDVPALMRDHPNLMELRTFSKAYGLAALRVGYGFGHPDLMAKIRRFQLPFGINAVAAAAVEASLRAQDELRLRVDGIIAERDRLRRVLVESGWDVPPSHANLLWLAAPAPVDDFAHALATAGIVIRHYPGEGVRITVGDRRDNNAVLDALEQLSPVLL